MTIEQQIADLTAATTRLLDAVNLSKQTLDAKVGASDASAVAAASSAELAAKRLLDCVANVDKALKIFGTAETFAKYKDAADAVNAAVASANSAIASAKQASEISQAMSSYKSQLDSAVAAQKTAYDGWKAGLQNAILKSRRLAVKNQLVDKATVIGTDSEKVDANDPSKSKWVLVSEDRVYCNPGCVVNIDTAACSSAPPGYFETPDKYAKDQCITKMQFLISNCGATSDQINDQISKAGLQIPMYGAWSNDSQMLRTTCVSVPDIHPYMGLFVRFVNLVYTGNGSPQEITKFGGNSGARVRFAECYLDVK